MTDHPKGQPIHTPFLNWPVEHYPDGTHKIGGSGAPIDASYVTTASEPKLTNEKVLGSEIIMRGPAASRPSPGIPGRLYIENDGDQRTLRDDGNKTTYLTGTEKEWSELICKVCGQKMNIPSKETETENGIGEPRKR